MTGHYTSSKQARFTPEGYNCYWMSVDASLKFWDKTLSEILVKWQKKFAFKQHAVYKTDNRIKNMQYSGYNRKMPTPPPV